MWVAIDSLFFITFHVVAIATKYLDVGVLDPLEESFPFRARLVWLVTIARFDVIELERTPIVCVLATLVTAHYFFVKLLGPLGAQFVEVSVVSIELETRCTVLVILLVLPHGHVTRTVLHVFLPCVV